MRDSGLLLVKRDWLSPVVEWHWPLFSTPADTGQFEAYYEGVNLFIEGQGLVVRYYRNPSQEFSEPLYLDKGAPASGPGGSRAVFQVYCVHPMG